MQARGAHPEHGSGEEPGSRSDPQEPGEDPLTTAYAQQTLQLREARSALGEAVHTLRLELDSARHENGALQNKHSALQNKHSALHDEWKALGAEVEWLREQRTSLMDETARLERELRAIQSRRIVRWSAGARRIFRRSRQ